MESKYGKLYIVATPIGNLEDITLRALKVLQEVDVIAAEDTRHTLKLLNHFNISKPLISYHRHNEDFKVVNIIEKLKSGENVAIVSDAGTPGISDPGEIAIKAAIEEEIGIIPIPGACAMINALIASGIDTKEFTFIGFLPLNKKLRREKLKELQNSNKTVILYEAPHKLESTLSDLKQIVESRSVVIARELTKIHEEFIRGKIDEVIEKTKGVRGEIVIIIEKKVVEEKEEIKLNIEEQYEVYEKEGMNKKDIIKKIAKERELSKNEVYMKFIDK